MESPYCANFETLVGEALFAVPGAEQIFDRHGCDATVECTEYHHAEYTLGDTEVVCHVDDVEALIDDLNAAIEADDGARRRAGLRGASEHSRQHAGPGDVK
jgi:hypothetical protein